MPAKYKPVMPASYHWHESEDGNVAITLTLPLPSRHVSPNARRGQSRAAAIAKSRHVKQHRQRAYLITLAALGTGPTPSITGYRLAFFWPTAAYRDDDNADASCKSYRDGIADALGIDDRHFRKLRLSEHFRDSQRPRLELTIHTADREP